MKTKVITFVLALSFLASCTVIQPGYVGVKSRFGVLSKQVLDPGAHFTGMAVQIIIMPVGTRNIEINLNLPSKEGLNINSNISILYRIQKDKVPEIIETIGNGYEKIITNVFRSASADVCAKFMAKDMHSGKRGEIEAEIQSRMSEVLMPRGIILEAVLLKNITLPEGLYNSIEDRLQAEQEALRMQFILEQEKLEAQRKIVEAKGTRDAQLILSEGLTSEIIQLRSIEAFKELSNSPATKIIITDGSSPFLINDNGVSSDTTKTK